MTKKDCEKLQTIREKMLIALQSAKDEHTLANNPTDTEYWNGQIVAYRDILRYLQQFPTPVEFLSAEILEIYNS